MFVAKVLFQLLKAVFSVVCPLKVQVSHSCDPQAQAGELVGLVVLGKASEFSVYASLELRSHLGVAEMGRGADEIDIEFTNAPSPDMKPFFSRIQMRADDVSPSVSFPISF